MAPTAFDPDPRSYLPHRPPFLLIDRILHLEPGRAARGSVALGAFLPFPPLFLVEAMAQLGGVAAGQQKGKGGVLAALREVTLPPLVLPGCEVTAESCVVARFAGLVQVEGRVWRGGEVIASALVTIAVEG